MRSLECYFGIYFPRCFATREINTKTTLSWALKQFGTRVHTLFSVCRYQHTILFDTSGHVQICLCYMDNTNLVHSKWDIMSIIFYLRWWNILPRPVNLCRKRKIWFSYGCPHISSMFLITGALQPLWASCILLIKMKDGLHATSVVEHQHMKIKNKLPINCSSTHLGRIMKPLPEPMLTYC